jgi:SWI/SNF-related matrix-associated actin-dependent regulator 1 of chromatin subfamily A
VPIPFFASLEQGEAVLRFPYDDRLRVLLRAIPGRRWDPGEKAWRIPLDPERAEALAKLLAGLPSRPHVSEALARAIARRRARRRDGECVLDLARPDENWWLSFPTDVDEELVRALAEHPDYRGLPAIGRALIPLDELSERIVKDLGEGGAGRLRLTEDAEHALTEIAYGVRAPRRMPRRRLLDAHAHAEESSEEEPAIPPALEMSSEQYARAQELVALSGATDGELDVPGLGGELKPFQRAGVSYLLAQRRAFLADEQGLGKTIEALATLQADDAFPAVVVCPASLKLNWLREIERWLPGRSARALGGRGASGVGARADITVINYDIVAARLDELRGLAPRALVLDESHYCKNARAKRTQAVQRLSAAVPNNGLVLALTGTPVMNRPPELISQLRIVGRLGDFGSGAQFGRYFRGPDAHVRLHWHLRARCFVRRLKADVLPQLPPKTRSVVPVELDNEYEYRFAERDVIAWLRSQPLNLRALDAKVAAALRAERLVRLNALKLLAARGKLHAALAWIHDFCSSGERLVVFAKHREIQRAVLERFPRALHILGQDGHAARDESLRAFQAADGAENQLIVCSIEVAGQGLTLTRSSNVVFLELDWTPAKHDQAEDRCHRIGQQDAVNATYLLAAGTIDETIATLLERKRAVIGAVTDGREQDEEGVVDALVRELAGEPYRALRAVA